MAKWNETPHGVIERAQNRFWSKLGNSAGSIARRLAENEGFAERLAEFARTEIYTGPQLFSIADSIYLPAISGALRPHLFALHNRLTGNEFAERQLLMTQPETPACRITALVSRGSWTTAEAALSILGTDLDASVQKLAELLKKRGHLLTLPQISAVIDLAEFGADTGLQMDGWRNCFFTEADSSDPGVVVCSMYRNVGGKWRVEILPVGDQTCGPRWPLLVRDLDATRIARL